MISPWNGRLSLEGMGRILTTPKRSSPNQRPERDENETALRVAEHATADRASENGMNPAAVALGKPGDL